MQVLCKKSEEKIDVRCAVCGAGFAMYSERRERAEQIRAQRMVEETLAAHHENSEGAHPEVGFTVPEWGGMAKYSGAALLGHAPEWAV